MDAAVVVAVVNEGTLATATKPQTLMVTTLETTQILMTTMMDSTTLMMPSHWIHQKHSTLTETALETTLMQTMMVMVLRIQSTTVNLLLIPTKQTQMAME